MTDEQVERAVYALEKIAWLLADIHDDGCDDDALRDLHRARPWTAPRDKDV